VRDEGDDHSPSPLAPRRPPALALLSPSSASLFFTALSSLSDRLTSSLSSRQAVPKFHGIVWIALSLSLEYLKHQASAAAAFLRRMLDKYTYNGGVPRGVLIVLPCPVTSNIEGRSGGCDVWMDEEGLRTDHQTCSTFHIRGRSQDLFVTSILSIHLGFVQG